MKKILIILLLTSSQFLKANIFDDIGDFAGGVVDTVGHIAKQIGEGVVTAGKKIGEGVVIAGKKIVDCSKIVGLGVADTAMKAGAPIIEAVKKGTSAVAFESAKVALKAAKETTSGILDLTEKILKDITKNFQIKCVRFFGNFDDIQLELEGTVLGKKIELKEKLKVSSPEDLTNQVYKKILDAFSIKDIF